MIKISYNVFMLVLLRNIFMLCTVAVHGNARNSKISRKLSTQTDTWTRTALSNTFAIVASSCTIKLCSILGGFNNVSIYLI